MVKKYVVQLNIKVVVTYNNEYHTELSNIVSV